MSDRTVGGVVGSFRPLLPPLIAAVLLLLPMTAAPLGAQTPSAASLSISSASALAGESVTLQVSLEGTFNLAALAFVLEFDASRMSLDTTASRETLRIPSGFEASLFLIAPGRAGTTLYDPHPPFSTLGNGPVIRVPFILAPGSDGFAAVKIASDPAPVGSSPAEQMMTVSVARAGGVTITPLRPVLSVSSGHLDFGNVLPDQTVERPIIISNIGTADLTLSRVELQNLTGEFSIVDGLSLPQVLRPGASLVIRVQFRASRDGFFPARILVDGAPETLSAVIPLSATVVGSSGFVYTTRHLIPSVAHLRGVGESEWRSTLSLFNAGDSVAGARLTFLPAGPGSPPSLAELTLAPRQTRVFDDLVRDLFGLSNSSGAVIIEVSSSELDVRSSIANVRPDGGRVSQIIPVVKWSDLVRSGEKVSLIGLDRSADVQTSVALLNLGAAPATLRLTVLDREGVALGFKEYVLSPGSIALNVDLFQALEIGEAQDLTIILEATSADATFYGYASTMDSRSGAPLFQPPR